jgi:hypothetical protein
LSSSGEMDGAPRHGARPRGCLVGRSVFSVAREFYEEFLNCIPDVAVLALCDSLVLRLCYLLAAMARAGSSGQNLFGASTELTSPITHYRAPH